MSYTENTTLRRVHCTSFCRIQVLKLLHARTPAVTMSKSMGLIQLTTACTQSMCDQSDCLLENTCISQLHGSSYREENKSLFSAQVGLRIINLSVWPSSQKHFGLIWTEDKCFPWLSLDASKKSTPKMRHRKPHLAFRLQNWSSKSLSRKHSANSEGFLKKQRAEPRVCNTKEELFAVLGAAASFFSSEPFNNQLF